LPRLPIALPYAWNVDKGEKDAVWFITLLGVGGWYVRGLLLGAHTLSMATLMPGFSMASMRTMLSPVFSTSSSVRITGTPGAMHASSVYDVKRRPSSTTD
jgi:hypothetical protein